MPDAADIVLTSVFLVRSEHLNHHGHVFGGVLMAEIDTVGFCFVRQVFPDNSFVTRAAQIDFIKPALPGDTIRFEARLGRRGTSSVEVEVTASVGDDAVGAGRMVYVNIDEAGRKQAL